MDCNNITDSLPAVFLDSGGYPSEEYLAWIEGFDFSDVGLFLPFAEAICCHWHFDDWGARMMRMYGGKRTMYLSTGGWSGNEDIIYSLRKTFWWSWCWVSSKRGGHYRFEIPVKKEQ